MKRGKILIEGDGVEGLREEMEMEERGWRVKILEKEKEI